MHRRLLFPGLDMCRNVTPKVAARRHQLAWKNDRSHEQIVFPPPLLLSDAAVSSQGPPHGHRSGDAFLQDKLIYI